MSELKPNANTLVASNPSSIFLSVAYYSSFSSSYTLMLEKGLSYTKGSDIFSRLSLVITSFPVPIGGIVIAIFVTPMIQPNTQQQRQTIIFLLGTLIVGLTAYLLYDNRRKNQPAGSQSPRSKSASTTTRDKAPTSERSTTTTPYRIKNIWEAGKSPGPSKKGTDHTDKPFGSKYYYAHNNPNATGGYKDGLKMEDFRMNGPRLLSKNGQSAIDLMEDTLQDDDGLVEKEPISATSRTQSFSAQDPNVRMITKYLWDDPGDTNGIATIRIDVLPGKTTGEYVDCKDVQIGNVEAKLAGEGLVVKVNSNQDGCESIYQLKIPKLYGDAADVKAVVKPKRLLIKIMKKKNSVFSMKKSGSNLDVWPQPHRNI
jgi:hypothetical protein